MNLVSLLPTSKLIAANNGGQAITDLSSDYTGQAKFILSAKSDAGSSPTLAVKLQSSPPLARLADVTPAEGDATDAIGHRTATDTSIKLAASFTLPSAASISKLYLPLKKDGAPTGTLTVAIFADDEGDPTGSALATFSTLNVATLTTSFSEILFTLGTPVDLAAGTYHIVATSDVTVSNTAFVSWNSVTVESGGNASIYDEAWAADATVNFALKAFFYQFSDVASFASVATTSSQQTIEINVDTLGVVRPHVTIGGTSSPAFYASVVALAKSFP
jgi:hypothetical protein